jgi:hypothetical protein
VISRIGTFVFPPAHYLTDGDVVEATVSTDDGTINLGRQRTIVRDAR